MDKVLTVNELIQWSLDSGSYTERILWVDEGIAIVYVIDIDNAKALPKVRSGAEINEALECGIASRLMEDPQMKLVIEDEIKAKDKLSRDQAWNIIESMVSPDNEPMIFRREIRGPMVQQAVIQFGVTARTVYKYLRRYWQRGKTIDALLPDYDNSGGRGKPKAAGEKKRGRPRKNPIEIGVGINVDEDTKSIFRVAITQFYNNEKENPLKDAYLLMIKKYYKDEVRYDAGVEKSIIMPSDKIPTETQFKYWYEQERNIKKEKKARKGAKKYELEHRPVLGSSETEVYGPGSVYQIDATVADVYLVSRYNRNWIIGRPVIYVLIDVFTRMVTGVYVGLEGPSWLGAMMCLANAASDKVAFCSDYQINIQEDEWPCSGIPEKIVADRGEMLSKKVKPSIPALNVKVQVLPAYRPDWKGIVEQYFKTIHSYVKPFVPGYIDKDFRERGSRDYRLDAKLDLYQFTQIILKCILYHNNSHLLKTYNRDETMIPDEISAIPIQLWNWGIRNCSGHLRKFPEDIVKLNLMPHENARVTAGGIIFKKMRYSCEKGLREMWFDKAREKTWQIGICYDPRNMNSIYIPDADSRGFEKCYLLDSQTRYLDKRMEEIEYLLEVEKLENQKMNHTVLQSKADLVSDIEHIVKQGTQMTDEAKIKKSDRSITKGIRAHRAFEKMKNRENEAFKLGTKESKPDNAKVVSPGKHQKDSQLELLKRKQEERNHGKE